MQNIIAKIETITPDRARQLLDTLSPVQRNRRKGHVKYIRHEIESNHWKLNGETIKITPEGKVIDGQHRLCAILESGKAIDTVVVFGVDEQAYNSIDTGVRRNAADALQMRGERHYTILASAIGICSAMENNVRKGSLLGRLRSPIDTEEYLDRNRKIKESAELAAQYYTRLIHPSVVAAIHYLYAKAKANPDLLEVFVTGLKEGFTHTRQPNFHLFREKLIANAAATAKVRRNTIIAWAIIAINATLAREKLIKIHWGLRDEFPVITIP